MHRFTVKRAMGGEHRSKSPDNEGELIGDGCALFVLVVSMASGQDDSQGLARATHIPRHYVQKRVNALMKPGSRKRSGVRLLFSSKFHLGEIPCTTVPRR